MRIVAGSLAIADVRYKGQAGAIVLRAFVSWGDERGRRKWVEEGTLSGSTRRSTYAEGVIPKRGSAEAPL
jgi:hypothetical protein